MTLKTTLDKLTALRAQLEALGLDAYLIPSSDEHLNEYLPHYSQRRAWLSGFDGSAGDLLVSNEQAWLFVDSRYHEQADLQVDHQHIQVCKLGLEIHPTLTQTLKLLVQNHTGPFRLGLDPATYSMAAYKSLQESLSQVGGDIHPTTDNVIDRLWAEQPKRPNTPVFAVPTQIAGLSLADKLAELRKAMKEGGINLLPITKLDQVAWLFNLRAQDIDYNPVFIAFALITHKHAYLFTDTSRFSEAALQSLAGHVELAPYTSYTEQLLREVQQAASPQTILLAPKHTSEKTHQLVKGSSAVIRTGDHPIEHLKALKNPIELAGMRDANIKASRGKIRSWFWLENQLAQRRPVSEKDFQGAIERFYQLEDGYFDLSFNTIAATGEHGAIVHYGTPSPEAYLTPGDLFLIDSGCQFYSPTNSEAGSPGRMGTTDDTRTWLIGETASPEQRHRYTSVLKAHIHIAKQRFPHGTDGARLDGITRAPLWQEGLDYGHDTGHGVGCFLSVHEGPNGIHRLASTALCPGMITSVEPGYYLSDWGGIRLENLYEVVERGNGFYGFESLTYIPFDARLIHWEALSPEELAWLSGYYDAILTTIGPTLPQEEGYWLRRMCNIPGH